ncbi:hypothetical protein GCM10023187_06460 [Nibrella viscosa]|uniref:Lipocalin-like domain-containing protein n=1 Tax=Nibrella viscosa TaxID=1084524 RepID=A0ABP8JX07_9BACT
MFAKHCLLLFLLSFAVVLSAAAQTSLSTTGDNPAAFVGKWAGTYTGASTGKCEMEITRNADGKYDGTITVIPVDESRYNIKFKTLTLEGNKLKATYNEPGEGTPISLEGTLTDTTVKGTYEADGGNATGTWTMTRQPK